MANGWTVARRARQATLIQRWRPWEQSTGPKTLAGRARVSRNAFKGGWRRQFRELRRLLREQDQTVGDRAARRPDRLRKLVLTVADKLQ